MPTQQQNPSPEILPRNFPQGAMYQCIQECNFNKYPQGSKLKQPDQPLRVGIKGTVIDYNVNSQGLLVEMPVKSTAPGGQTTVKAVLPWDPYVCIWPEGFPFRCRQAFNGDTSKGQLVLKQGDEGQVMQLAYKRKDMGWRIQEKKPGKFLPWIDVQVDGGGRGLVPVQSLDIGRVNCRYVISIEYSLPKHIPISYKFNSPATLYRRLIEAWATGLQQLDGNALNLPTAFSEVLRDSGKRVAFINYVYEGTRKAGLVNLYNRGNFSLGELLSTGQDATTCEALTGIYKCGYKNFKKGSPYHGHDPKLYDGSSNNIPKRMKDHDRDCLKIWSYHYDARRATPPKDMKAVVLWIGDEDYRLKWVEEFHFCLFNNFHPTLLNFEEKSVQQEEAVRMQSSKEHATVLSRMMLEIFREVGWTSYCGHKSFGASGLNRSLPTQEMTPNERVIWTKTQSPNGKVTVFTRAPIELRSVKPSKPQDGKEVMHMFTHQKGNVDWRIQLSADAGPPVGTLVYPAFEIYESGSHPCPWACLPMLGPMDDWLDANKLACRIDWQAADGSWESMYIQRRSNVKMLKKDSGTVSLDTFTTSATFLTPDPGKVRGILDVYVRARAVERWLQQESVIDDWPWMDGYGNARVKEVVPDRFQNVLRIVPPQSRLVARASVANFQDLKNQMISAGLQHVGTWQGQAPGLPRGPKQRNRCDFCYAQGRHDPNYRCVKRDRDGCNNCYARGLPCSWSPSPLFQAPGQPLDLLTPLETCGNAVLDIGEPEKERFLA
ncbi:hypothetical protein LTR10_016084 [Elasticomyces elasticus]|uniref:Uncharacterized protein n=1 Tax=Exophiala sideris TaxID=1016849 RepID=A0ABR0J1F8_9EURO|nr:hypothetical protein LTR10_016084 [Elasticomyces elasticus]KAK5024579.1 hypothetical protein LTS07_008425 [Exophiala sideris]KAK5030673.1 hypothetical protein LTR13_008027 [Exophiala sideris]KAK5054212.1 hypothetical protein LTR69_008827 [Exophiala sideris]KAK5179614.1 hypothetical protein LTR44_007782 [Eurotiomycetes sp. CCFEE 6388]